MSNRIKKFDGGGEVGGSGFAWGLAQEMANPELGMISDAQYTDRIISMIEDGYYYGQTPEQLAADELGLSVAQMKGRTEDMLDSILKSQGENETGFVDESARLAAEGILKGKIAQAGVTDPAAQEAALKSAMESLEGGASGLEAVKAAAGGAQDYVEELLKTAKDIIDKGYDATIGKLPEILTPESILADIIGGNVTAVFEIGETGGALPGATSPIFGGTVGTVGGGTNVGIMTTGNAVLDAVIRAAEGGVDQQDIEKVVGAVISANTGIPADIVNAGIEGTKEAINAAKTVVGANVTDGDDTTDITLTNGTLTTRTCDDGSVVGIDAACPEDITTLVGGDGTGTDGSTTGATVTLNEDDDEVVCGDNQYKDFTTGQCVDIPCPAGQERDKNGNCYTPGVGDRTIVDDDLTAAFDPCPEGSGKSRNAEGNCVCPGGMIDAGNGVCVPLDNEDDDDDECNDCTCEEYAFANPDLCPPVDLCDDPVYAAQNQDKCGGGVNLCDDPVYAAQNQDKCGGGVNLCDDPVYAAQNQDKCGGSVNLCDDPVYAAQNLAKCFTDSGNPCDDPVYAAQNKDKCGVISGDPCEDPAYAASRPGECGVISGDPCEDPAYAAANPAECGIVVPPETPAVPTLPTMQGYRAVQTEPGPLVDIDYLYDISGPSIFAPTMEEEDKYNPLGMYSPYAEGGIVQDYDIEELIRFLESQRG